MNESCTPINFRVSEFTALIAANRLTHQEENALINALVSNSCKRGDQTALQSRIDQQIKECNESRKADLLKDIAKAFNNYFEAGFSFSLAINETYITACDFDPCDDVYGRPAIEFAEIEFNSMDELAECVRFPTITNDNEKED